MATVKYENDYKKGSLPGAYAPLAVAYVPMQISAKPAYDTAEALSRGTLFPGLDLPFMNIVNEDMVLTPENEILAICFVTDELVLYLDTHAEDQEAFEMLQTFLALRQEAQERYVKAYGPITQQDLLHEQKYTWLKNPWPWDYQPKMEV